MTPFLDHTKYFNIGWVICDRTMCPIAQFTNKETGEMFSFRVPRQDIEDYSTGISYPKSLKNVDDFVKQYKRDINLGNILKD